MNKQTMTRIINEINANSSWVDDWGEKAISVRDLYNILSDIPVI